MLGMTPVAGGVPAVNKAGRKKDDGAHHLEVICWGLLVVCFFKNIVIFSFHSGSGMFGEELSAISMRFLQSHRNIHTLWLAGQRQEEEKSTAQALLLPWRGPHGLRDFPGSASALGLGNTKRILWWRTPVLCFPSCWWPRSPHSEQLCALTAPPWSCGKMGC